MPRSRGLPAYCARIARETPKREQTIGSTTTRIATSESGCQVKPSDLQGELDLETDRLPLSDTAAGSRRPAWIVSQYQSVLTKLYNTAQYSKMYPKQHHRLTYRIH